MDIVFMVPSNTFLFDGWGGIDKYRIGIKTSSIKSEQRFIEEFRKLIRCSELYSGYRSCPCFVISYREASTNRMPIDELREACQQLAKSQGLDLCEDEDIVRMACERWTRSALESMGLYPFA